MGRHYRRRPTHRRPRGYERGPADTRPDIDRYRSFSRPNPGLSQTALDYIRDLSPEDRQQIQDFIASRGHGRIVSRNARIALQQLLAAACRVRQSYWAYTDGVIGPRTRRLLHEALDNNHFGTLQELLGINTTGTLDVA